MARKLHPAETTAASTTEPADRLELLFEARVARALDRLGVPRGAQIHELTTLLERLCDRIDALDAAAITSAARAAEPDDPAAGMAAPLVTRAATPRRPRRTPRAAAANPKPGR